MTVKHENLPLSDKNCDADASKNTIAQEKIIESEEMVPLTEAQHMEIAKAEPEFRGKIISSLL